MISLILTNLEQVMEMYCKNTYNWRVFLFGNIGGSINIVKNMSSRNTVSNSVTNKTIDGGTPLVCWYLYCQNPTFDR